MNDFKDQFRYNYILDCCNDLVAYNYLYHVKTLNFNPSNMKPPVTRLIALPKDFSLANVPLFHCMLSSLHHLGCSVAFFIHTTPNSPPDFYLGIQDQRTMPISLDLVNTTLSIILPANSFIIFSVAESLHILSHQLLDLHASTSISNATFSCRMSLDPRHNPFSPNTNDYLALLPNTTYTLMFLAVPKSAQHIYSLCKELDDFTTELATYQSITYTDTTKDACANKKDAFDDTIKTCTDTKTANRAHTDTCTDTNNYSANIKPTTSGKITPAATLGHTNTDTHTCNDSDNNTCSSQETCIRKQLRSDSAENSSTSSCTYKVVNVFTTTLTDTVNERATELRGAATCCLFDYSMYCIAPKADTSLLHAFNSILLTKQTPIHINNSFVQNWTQEDARFKPLLKELLSFSHPSFIARSGKDVSLSSPVTAEELQVVLPLTSGKGGRGTGDGGRGTEKAQEIKMGKGER